MAFALPVLAAVASGFGIYSTIKSATQKADTPQPTATPALPTAEDSVKKAQDEIARRRRSSLLSGGQTIATSPAGSLFQPGQTQRKTLLGQ